MDVSLKARIAVASIRKTGRGKKVLPGNDWVASKADTLSALQVSFFTEQFTQDAFVDPAARW